MEEIISKRGVRIKPCWQSLFQTPIAASADASQNKRLCLLKPGISYPIRASVDCFGNSIVSWQGGLTIFVTMSVLLLLAFSRAAPHAVMLAAVVILSTAGILTPAEAFSGFSNPGILTVAALFVVAAGLKGAGAVGFLVDRCLGAPSTVRSALCRMSLPVMLLSAFMNNTPVVATMLPAVKLWARRINIPVSKLMIPLSYAAILGGTLTLIGTSTNLVVNSQYQQLTGETGFSLFSITLVGLPVAVLGLLWMCLFFPRWLPRRETEQIFSNLREFTLEVMVEPGGPLVGKTVQQAGLRNLHRIYLVEIERQGAIIAAVPTEERLQGGDKLIFAGDTQAISDLLHIRGITASVTEGEGISLEKSRSERCLVEVVVSPHCSSIGEAIRDARFRDRYGAVVLAVARHGERIQGNLGTIQLEAGDSLLLEARPGFVSRQRLAKDFLLLSQLEDAPPRHDLAVKAFLVLAALILAVASGLVSMLNGALIAAGLMILLGCCSMSQAEKSLDLMVLVTIAASFGLGLALDKTGVAASAANFMILMCADQPWLLLLMTYFVVSLLTEFISNNAAAILSLPIVLDMTARSELNQEPYVLAIMMAASASFATPLGYQTNMMVYGPGGYQFRDFLAVGLPMNVFVGAVTILVLLLGWPLSA